MKKGIFRRIFILSAVVILAAILVIEVYITDAVRKNYIVNLRAGLGIQAALISGSVPFETRSPIDALCRQFKETTGARVTVIAPDGTVIGDSDKDSSLMDNHAGRPEIQQALLTGSGMYIRYSDTLKHDFLYVAKTVTKGGRPAGFIRLSVPLNEVDESVNALRTKIIVVVTLLVLAAGLFSAWQTEHIRRLTGQIRDYSRSLARGDLGKKLFLTRAGEFNEIAESLNALSAEMENRIAESEEEKNRLNVILRSIPDILFILDAKGAVVLANAAAGQYFGSAPLKGRPFIEVVRNAEIFSLMDDVRKHHAAGITEFRLALPEERHFVVRVSPLFYRRSEPSGFVAVFHDITQLKKLEQTRKDFVANISHEIKTPITAIGGFADTLLEGALHDTENAVKFLQTIRSNSERINSLVDDLMTISKIELGVIKIEKSETNISELLDHVLTILRDKASAKGLALATRVNPSLHGITADRDRLVQILTNLVDNAIKFTDTGGVTFGAEEEGGRTFLFVEDTGIGVPPKHLPRLGERFYRVDPGRSRNMGGTGLGLAIVKHLVKAHGWDMHIESTPGKGTKVKIFTA